MKQLIYLSILCCLFYSCSINKGSDFDSRAHTQSSGRKSCYLVDTIFIENAIIVRAKDNNIFIMAEKVFEQYNGKTSFFYTHPDVYFFDCNWMGFTLPGICIPDNIITCSSASQYSEADYSNRHKLATYRILYEPHKMLLVLINGPRYNSLCVGLNERVTQKDRIRPLRLRNLEFSYYKMVILACGKID